MPDSPVGRFAVWAVTWTGDEPEQRCADLEFENAVEEATLIARATSLTKARPAVSVWVEDDDGVVRWAAGRKAAELRDGKECAGYEVHRPDPGPVGADAEHTLRGRSDD